MCHMTEFDGSQRVRDGCTACMMLLASFQGYLPPLTCAVMQLRLSVGAVFEAALLVFKVK
jgi:hypothetical protein